MTGPSITYTNPTDGLKCGGGNWGSPSSAGVYFVMCDGSVRNISTNIGLAPWSAAVTATNDDGPPLD